MIFSRKQSSKLDREVGEGAFPLPTTPASPEGARVPLRTQTLLAQCRNQRRMVTILTRGLAACVLSGLCLFSVCAESSAEEWISIGPFGTWLPNNDVISGQMNALAVDPRDANILYVGASEGGVWKTSDGGATWTALTDTQLVRKLRSGKSKGTLSIASLAIDPANSETVYAGTGDPNVACCLQGPGLGVFRSTDGGSNWVPLGTNLSQAGCENGAMSQHNRQQDARGSGSSFDAPYEFVAEPCC